MRTALAGARLGREGSRTIEVRDPGDDRALAARLGEAVRDPRRG